MSDASYPHNRENDPSAEIPLVQRSRWHRDEWGIYLFIASLTMLFAASLISYIIVRLSNAGLSSSARLSMPPSLWISTAALLGTSVALAIAQVGVKREKQLRMRRWLAVACSLAILFLFVQSWGLVDIFDRHFDQINKQISLYGIVFSLVLLHAIHVLGGIFVLGVSTVRGFRGKYDHECHRGLKLCTVYWHFLDVVWLVMLATFLLTA